MKSFLEYLNECDLISEDFDKGKLRPVFQQLPNEVFLKIQKLPIELDNRGRLIQSDYDKIVKHIEDHLKSLKLYTPIKNNPYWDSPSMRKPSPYDTETFKFGYFQFDDYAPDPTFGTDRNDSYYDDFGILKINVGVGRTIKFKFNSINVDSYRQAKIKWEKEYGNLDNFEIDPSRYKPNTYYFPISIFIKIINYDPKKVDSAAVNTYGKPRFYIIARNFGEASSGKSWKSSEYPLSQLGQILSSSFWNSTLKKVLPLFMTRDLYDMSKRHKIKDILTVY
ncbi:MAG: hypothetical protein LBD41_03520 [Clostridiales Family XIII bacterium]|nr:hypothetical protein [Clostridiales Family XIII bacterium]